MLVYIAKDRKSVETGAMAISLTICLLQCAGLQEKGSSVLNDSKSEDGRKVKMLARKLVTKCLRKLEEYNIQSSLGVKRTRI